MIKQKFSLGERVFHKTYGTGTICLSDNQSIAVFTAVFDNPLVATKYVCFDGVLERDLSGIGGW